MIILDNNEKIREFLLNFLIQPDKHVEFNTELIDYVIMDMTSKNTDTKHLNQIEFCLEMLYWEIRSNKEKGIILRWKETDLVL